MATTIEITDQASPLLQRLGRAAAEGPLTNAMGRGAANAVTSHLFRLDGSRANKLGGRRTHFFSAAAKATSMQSEPGGIRIVISSVGFRQRLEGGTIRPVNKKYLTIPARAEAYGKRAGEFNDLKVIFNKAGKPVGLAQADQSLVKIGRTRTDGSRKVTNKGEIGGLVLFWLVKKVTQRPDPTVLPTDRAIADAAITAGNTYLNEVVNRKS